MVVECQIGEQSNEFELRSEQLLGETSYTLRDI